MVSKLFTIWSNNNFLIVSHKVKMYTHIDVKNSSEWHYCYVTPFYGLWENVIPEIIIGLYK